jgi:5'-phosphate synthase pdxT subunit
MQNLKIGVLALQGGFAEHIAMLNSLAVTAVEVRLPSDLQGISGLIIPGGESTAISRLLRARQLLSAIKEMAAHHGLAIWGTCAGAILLAKEVDNLSPPGLQLMDIAVVRNVFGRQVDSFTTELEFADLGDVPFPAVFIRAPIIERVGKNVKVLVQLPDGRIVAARQNNFLVTSFHPELTGDNRFHKYFLQMISK